MTKVCLNSLLIQIIEMCVQANPRKLKYKWVGECKYGAGECKDEVNSRGDSTP